ncbi:hypothetical protein BC835DRAFT_1423036 [Cytidiella melzeri]|nr:hypothetical protein BC835DRAFT_1423036 [Cytidiella melzeri]
MAHISPPVFLLCILAVCYAEIIAVRHAQPPQRQITDLVPRHSVHNQQAHDQHPVAPFDEPFDLLDIVLVASVDGKLHALNRTSGDSLWSMSSPANTLTSDVTPLAPLVSTRHPTPDSNDHEAGQEVYIIEPQSGDIYVLPTPTSPLQRLPLSMSQLVDLSPYSISGDDSTKVFVGKKETSLVLLELETGRIKATLNSAECPWDPFEDLSRDRDNEEEEAFEFLDDLDESRPRKVRSASTEVFIGRTDYHISIFTRPLDHSLPRPPPQNLSFSTYGPNNQDGSFQSLYRRTPDDTYVQAMANGKIMSFQATPLANEAGMSTQPIWARAYAEPIVAIFDILRSPSRPKPFALLQPRLSLQDLLPNVDLSAAAKSDRLPNLEAAYVGIVEETGSLYVLSPDHYPLVVFGDTNNLEEQHGYGAEYGVGPSAGRLIDPPPGLGFEHDGGLLHDLESITRYMKRKKMKERCQEPGAAISDKKCLTGVRKLESSRLGRLLDGSATVPLPEFPVAQGPLGGSSRPGLLYDERVAAGNETLRPGPTEVVAQARLGAVLREGTTGGTTYALGALTIALAITLAWVLRTRRASSLVSTNTPPNSAASAVMLEVQQPKPSHTPYEHGSAVVTASGIEVHTQPQDSLAILPSDLPLDQPLATPPSKARKVSFGGALRTPAVSQDSAEDVNDGAGEVDDSDDDAPLVPRKKKTVNRRRGKKKPKALQLNGDTPVIADPIREPAKSITEISPSIVVPLPATPASSTPSLVVSDSILGFGSHGTVVFKGSLQGRAVAVKRLLQDFVTLASREVSVLQESDDHPNVIRYYYQEAHANFLYIALELCPASLADIIERPDHFRDISISFDPKRALRQITAGLRHLHALKIIHRDIKPPNILVSHAKKGVGESAGHRMLISDFGLCKKLEVDQTSFYPTAHGAMAAGTVGWRAPEILRGDVTIDGSGGEDSQSSRGSAYGSDVGTPTGRLTRLTKSVDVFALGCLFYYVLTNGGHPFGDRYERDVNILKNAKCLDGLERFGEEGSDAVDLITKMLDPEASRRPDTSTCLLHPYFWDPGKRLGFLQDASDRFEVMCRDPRDPLLVELERGAISVVGNDWNTRLDKWFIDNLGKYRKYDGKSVQDLMRALRNKKHHYQDLPDNVKRQIGTMPEGFLLYFTRRFPRLFLHVHSVVSSSQLRSESMFRSYFEVAE